MLTKLKIYCHKLFIIEVEVVYMYVYFVVGLLFLHNYSFILGCMETVVYPCFKQSKTARASSHTIPNKEYAMDGATKAFYYLRKYHCKKAVVGCT